MQEVHRESNRPERPYAAPQVPKSEPGLEERLEAVEGSVREAKLVLRVASVIVALFGLTFAGLLWKTEKKIGNMDAKVDESVKAAEKTLRDLTQDLAESLTATAERLEADMADHQKKLVDDLREKTLRPTYAIFVLEPVENARKGQEVPWGIRLLRSSPDWPGRRPVMPWSGDYRIDAVVGFNGTSRGQGGASVYAEEVLTSSYGELDAGTRALSWTGSLPKAGVELELRTTGEVGLNQAHHQTYIIVQYIGRRLATDRLDG